MAEYICRCIIGARADKETETLLLQDCQESRTHAGLLASDSARLIYHQAAKQWRLQF